MNNTSGQSVTPPQDDQPCSNQSTPRSPISPALADSSVPSASSPPTLQRQDPYLRNIAIIALCGAIALLLLGALWTLVFFAVLTKPTTALLSDTSQMDLLAFLGLLAGLTTSGGMIALYNSIRSLQGKVSRRMSLPSYGIWLLVYIAILVSGYGTHDSELDKVWPALFVLLPSIASWLPLILLAALSVQELVVPLAAQTWRKTTMAVICGAAVASQMALLTVFLLSDPFDYYFHACFSPTCAGQPGGYAGFFFLATIIPLIEELIKPLLLILYGKKFQTQTDAFYLGLICGAGYGSILSLLLILLLPRDWLMIAAISIAFPTLHGLTTGWTMTGWYHLIQKWPAYVFKTSGYWLSSLVLHMILYGSMAMFLLPGPLSSAMKFGITIADRQIDVVTAVVTGDLLLLGLCLLLSFTKLRRSHSSTVDHR